MTQTAATRTIEYTRIFDLLEASTKRIVSLRGGTRSSKTYNTLIWWIWKLKHETGKTLTIARNTMPALRASAMRDFFEILESMGLYSEANHNKSNNEYTFNGNLIEFIGVDQSERVRGRKRNYLFLNEANENTLESFRQLSFRTTDKIVLDYNPSDAFSWIYDDVETRDDCELFVTTYKDNPFLEPSLVSEIERLKDADQEYWNIYGLGLIGSGSSRVYSHWRPIDEADYPHGKGEKVFGLDFGYNNPTALAEVIMYDNTLHWRELLYESKLTNADLIQRLRLLPELARHLIIADAAEPQRIEEIKRAGFNIEPAFKLVKDTIDFVKSKPLRIHSGSANLLREIKRYSWKTDKAGNLTDDVVKMAEITWNANIEPANKAEIEKYLNPALWLVPGWCQLIHVNLFDSSTENKNSSCETNVDYEYRFIQLDVFTSWLNATAQEKWGNICHEMVHGFTNVTYYQARRAIIHACGDDEKFKEFALSELAQTNEAVTQDLTKVLCDKFKMQSESVS
jgi:phage terminase large subunit